METNKSLSRHPSLVPFSRDHHYGLVIAAKLKKAESENGEGKHAVVMDFMKEWQQQMQAHFLEEEEMLVRFMSEVEEVRFRDEHFQLRQLVDSAKVHLAKDDVPTGFASELGSLLHDHIRWEERELYESIQTNAGKVELDKLIERAQQIENSRSR